MIIDRTLRISIGIYCIVFSPFIVLGSMLTTISAYGSSFLLYFGLVVLVSGVGMTFADIPYQYWTNGRLRREALEKYPQLKQSQAMSKLAKKPITYAESMDDPHTWPDTFDIKIESLDTHQIALRHTCSLSVLRLETTTEEGCSMPYVGIVMGVPVNRYRIHSIKDSAGLPVKSRTMNQIVLNDLPCRIENHWRIEGELKN